MTIRLNHRPRTRRGLCALLLACLGAGLAGGAWMAQAGDSPCREAEPVPWQPVAPGVWAWLPAPPADGRSLGRDGHEATTSVLIHRGQALLVDPGPSHRHGVRVRASLACRFGARVRWIVNTHAHAENVLGNSAFADEQAAGRLDIVASAGTQEAMRQRCPDCLASLAERVGPQAMAGTRTVLPNRVVGDGEVLALGGQRLRVMVLPDAHTGSDLALWRPRDRLLWAGGLVYDGRLPELAQGSLDGWLVALARLAALRPGVIVHHGLSQATQPGGTAPALAATQAYLADLRAQVLRAMDEGRLAQDSAAQVPDTHRGWAGPAWRQSFNAQRAWRELEPLWMEGRADRPAAPGAASAPDVRR